MSAYDRGTHWRTEEGKVLAPKDFTDDHLMNTIRYIDRHDSRSAVWRQWHEIRLRLMAEAHNRNISEPCSCGKPVRTFVMKYGALRLTSVKGTVSMTVRLGKKSNTVWICKQCARVLADGWLERGVKVGEALARLFVKEDA